jgi:hypothetical protein
MTVVSTDGNGSAAAAAVPASTDLSVSGDQPAGSAPRFESPETGPRQRALADPAVQALLDVFAAEITKVEEI